MACSHFWAGPVERVRGGWLSLIGGGIGITSFLPWVANYWSVKKTLKCLVKTMDGASEVYCRKDVSVEHRLDFGELLVEEHCSVLELEMDAYSW
ncbi:hypothetical protein QBC33DRAFT_561247 [Phialemonium atrogriseum]|uniref:Uncharacterized protein n=1 Tax=Phialemonium atrogriseum TaxID=1093897 RepID=A0AAJ0FF12_9PEZI|nr:uncharacterized protein QBC33DRAFT_561247 [Phialemonium atrogriseum]KAK1764967.1 hypothetical protein QBC33DRAFT_561247 [Phialemonium atrogriseum]